MTSSIAVVAAADLNAMAVARTGVHVGATGVIEPVKVQTSEGDRRRAAVKYAYSAWVRREHLVDDVARVIEHLPNAVVGVGVAASLGNTEVVPRAYRRSGCSKQ